MQVVLPRSNRVKQLPKLPRVPINIPCGYCFQEWATSWDHIIPWVAGGGNNKDNLYPSCRKCNTILGSLIFDSLREKREYVRNYLISKGKWKYPEMSNMQERISNESSSPEVLQFKMPMGSLVTAENNRCRYCGKTIITKRFKTRKCVRYKRGYRYCCNEECYNKYMDDVMKMFNSRRSF